MKKKDLVDKIKYDLTQDSSPDYKRIIDKKDSLSRNDSIDYHSHVNIITSSVDMKKTILIVCMVMILALTIFFCFTYKFIFVDDSVRYGNTAELKWNFNITIDKYNEKNKTTFKQFHGLNYSTSASAIGIKHYLWVEYQYVSEEEYEFINISFRAAGNYFYPEDYKIMQVYENVDVINGYNLRYRKYVEVPDDIEDIVFYRYSIYIQERRGYNYFIEIEDIHDREIAYYLNFFY